MQHLGQQLRKAREEKGICLTTIQEVTKIRRHYLEALERGEFDVVPGEVYLKGFIRSYARVVGIDPEPLIDEYVALRAREAQADCAVPRSRLTRARHFLSQGVQGTLHWLGL